MDPCPVVRPIAPARGKSSPCSGPPEPSEWGRAPSTAPAPWPLPGPSCQQVGSPCPVPGSQHHSPHASTLARSLRVWLAPGEISLLLMGRRLGASNTPCRPASPGRGATLPTRPLPAAPAGRAQGAAGRKRHPPDSTEGGWHPEGRPLPTPLPSCPSAPNLRDLEGGRVHHAFPRTEIGR